MEPDQPLPDLSLPDLPLHGAGEAKPPVPTLTAMLDLAARDAGERVAVRHRDEALTYAELGRAATALARRLAAEGLAGEVTALLLPNSIAFVIAYFAALRARTAPALANPLYPAAQLEPLLREVGAVAAICTPDTREMARSLAPRAGLRRVLCFGEDITLEGLLAEPGEDGALPAPRPDDVAALLFTGGTTGLPKAVEYDHGQLLTALRCTDYNWPTRLGGDIWLPIAPFTHVYGFLQGLLGPVRAQAEMVIPERFKPEHVVDLLARHRVTVFGGGPPAIYAGLLAAPNLAGADLSALRVCPGGGAPFPMELIERWRRVTGLEIHEGYGMTEMPAISGITALSGLRPGSVGRPIPCNTVQVVDAETGRTVLPPGERGEVRFRGPHMMRGYRNRPEETSTVLRNGFIHTGDIGYLDGDGFLHITDRKKDVILVKGFNVYPREVEEAISLHPRVAAVGVVGVPDERSGERVVAYVVPVAGEALDEAEVAAHCAARLIAYRCPADIHIVDRLPLTGAQKLDRKALRALAQGE
ncbi:AMP-binding protein [Roseomonas sp. OT10]|uniref:class I adenylate-forming enzyme family protein n=1 Tax=Roseomonas cutis TaxID=2897332 RepID=UPI001E5BB8F2|nr:AMP-binding protein [Roseomonas sp. OT10]UFN47182.1 AMP-binding protein [Roseomonas sp. OT10]